MQLKSLAISLLCVAGVSTACAQTLNTFVDGQPAVAAQVNQNFTLLLNEIDALKAQVAALQPVALSQAVVGTWDVAAMDSTTFEQAGRPSANFFIRSGGNESVLVLRADGTFTNTSVGRVHQMEVFVVSHQVLLPAPAGSTNPSGGVGVKQVYTGLFPDRPDNATVSGTYTLSGNKLTLRVGARSLTVNLSRDGEVMTLYDTGDGENTIAVGLKR